MSPRKLYPAMLLILLPLAVSVAAPGQQASDTQSVADAARKSRDLKDKAQAKPAKVITDDDISGIKGTISVVGPGQDAPADATKAADATKTDQPGETKDEAYWRTKFAAARKTLSDDARELDLLQREFNLKQQQFYSDPNVALREQNSRQDLDDTQKKIDDKKAAVDKDKQAITDLEDELRKSGGDSSWAVDNTPPPVPAQPPSDGQPNTP